jgi:hypothetical protein
MIRNIFKWIFKDELISLNREIKKAETISRKLNEQKTIIDAFLKNVDVSVDVHEYKYSPSWAVISIQGQKTDFIKFVDLGQSEIHEISRFLRNFERSNFNTKVDASPSASNFLRIPRKR